MKVAFHNFLITTFCLLSLSIVLCGQVTGSAEETKSQDESKQRAAALWEQAVVAKGGRERLYQVNSLLISYQGTVRNFFGTVVHRGFVERLYVFPYKSWSWDNGLPPPFNLTVSMFNQERNLSCTISAGDRSPKCTEPKNAASFFNQAEGLARVQYLYLLETKWIRPLPVKLAKDSIGLKTVDVVQTRVAGRRVDYYLDRKTHLPQRIITFFESGRVWEVYNFSDYVNINGIQMPGVQKKGKINFQINLAYAGSIFTHPPSIEAGPNAWQSGNR